MLSILAIGDPHFKVSNMTDCQLMTAAILNLVKSTKPTFVVVLGDVLDRHELIHVSPLTAAVKFLKELAAIVPLYVLIGNHDRPNNSDFLSDRHPFTGLKEYQNIVIVDKTLSTSHQGTQFTFVPYVPPGSFLQALSIESDEWKKSKIIFAHQEFKNAQMGAIRSVVGDEWSLENPYVISGHIHDFHQLQPNILYTGTPMQHAFGDRDDKSVTLITFDELGKVLHKQIDLGLPRRIMVNLVASQIDGYSPPSGQTLKIIIHGTMAELKTVAKMDKIKSWTKAGIKVVYKEIAESQIIQPAKPGISFVDALYSATKDSPDLANLVKELFGEIGPKKSPMKLIIRDE